MECQKCKSWKRSPTKDKDLIDTHHLWTWGNNALHTCNICGAEVARKSNKNTIVEHIIKNHRDMLYRLRNTSIGVCVNKHFMCVDFIPNTREIEHKSLCIYSEEGSLFWTDQEFGCIHYEEQQ
jgi:predicted transcriptional regulator